MEDYPVELRRHPVPVVGMVGNNGIQEKLKEAFVHEGKSALKLLQYDFGDPIPVLRPPKRVSYDSYVPRGILKANWLHKIVNVEAAVITLFYDWRDKEGKDKEGKPWHARELDISQQITEMLKLFSSLGAKPSNRILIVFVFPSGLLPDSVYEERITILRKRVDLSDKCFFTLYENDFVKISPNSSVSRLENVLKEIANMQYIDEAKRLKKEKDIINRRALPQVYTRNHFKIAYLHEFSFDIRGSLKYYTYAYNYLREVPKDRRSIPEIKVLADYMNYKLCKLHLTNTKIEAGINDAVNQFQRHIKLYKNLIGASDRETEHWAWVGRQYEVMAQLLQKYTYGKWFPFPSSLRHPAYYYQCAAFYASERKLNAFKNALKFPEKKLAQYSSLQPINPASIDISRQRYVGQEIDPPSPDDPSDDSSLQRAAREYFLPHSLIITSLLSKGLELYESQRKEAVAVGIKDTPKNDRMILYINSLIADEHFSSADFVKAKAIYDTLAGYFGKNNKWSYIMGSIYLKALHCAQRLSDIKDFVKYSLELCIPAVKIEQAEREQIQANLMEVINAPLRIGFSPLSHPLTIELNQLHPLLSANFQFASPEVFANSPTSFRILLLSHFPLPIHFSSISIVFNIEEYNRKIYDERMEKEGEKKRLRMEPKEERQLEFAITPTSLGTLQAKHIILEIGDEAAPSSSIKFVWTLSDWPPAPPSNLLLPPRSFLFLPSLLIKEREAKVGIKMRHLPPALVNEYYRVDVVIENGEEKIESGRMFFSMQNAPPLQSEDHSFFLHHLHQQQQQQQEGEGEEGEEERGEGGNEFRAIVSNKGYRVGAIERGEERVIRVYVFSPASAKDRQITVQLHYSTAAYSSLLSSSFPAPVTLPLTARCAFFTSSFASCLDPVNGTTIRAEESSIMRVEVQNKCPYPLEILAADLDLNPNALSLSSTSHLFFSSDRCVLSHLDKFTTWFQFAPQSVGNDVNIGVFKMKWKRHPHPAQLPLSHDDLSRLVITPTLIPPLKVSKSPFTSDVEVPPFGVVGEPMQYVVTISNHTNRMEEISLVVQESDHFVIAGTKVSTFKIFPSSKYLLSHTIVPLKSGKVPLPYFQISSKRFAKEMSGTKQKRFIYIQPQQPSLSS